MIKKQEKKLKFNIVDAIVLLLALLCIFTIVSRAFVIGDKYTTDYSAYTVYFEIDEDDIATTSLHLWASGMSVRTFDGYEIGILDGELTVEKREEYTDNDTEAKEEHVYLCGKVLANVVLTEDGFVLNSGIPIAINEEIEIVTENVRTIIKVLSIEKRE